MERLLSQSYTFSDFTLDLRRGCLLRGQEEVKLRPKAFEMLTYLVRHSGRLIGKEELIQAVWPDSIVGDGSLVQCLRDLRLTLGDESQQLIKTVPRRGYIFDMEVKEGSAPPGVIYAGEVDAIRVVVEEEVTEAEKGEITQAERGKMSAATSASLIRGWMTGRRVLALSLLVGLVAAVSWLWIPAPPRPQTIAVLPFRPLSEDGRDEYLELGMADALITRLSNVRQIIVRPTSAVRRYAGPGQDVVAAGRNLRVEAVLEGSVQKTGEKLRVTVQLVSVRDGSPLWGQTFDESFTNVFAVQDSISEQVARALTVKLTGAERKSLAKRHTEDTEAWRLYLSGRYHWNKRTPEDTKKAIAYFQQAIEKDAKYAQAWAGLADCYAVFSSLSGLPPKESMPKAKEAALTALALDNSLAEAHATLASIRSIYDWDWPAAEREFRLAIELNPGYATAHHWYSNLLSFQGRAEEAFAEIKRAQEIDPLSPMINEVVGWHRHLARQYDEAIRLQRQALDLEPNFPAARFGLGTSYEQTGRYEEAVAEFKKAVSLAPDDFDYLAALGHVYAVTGRRAEARRILEELKEFSKRRYVSAWQMAVIHAGLGEQDDAFEWLARAADERSFWMSKLKVEPRLDGLRADPRFADLLRRVGLGQ
jgi:TolB-like protein/DNA-binding winged helix-turn-helix (wHTH) protein/tetratricopeptide (TPR) repeat protein